MTAYDELAATWRSSLMDTHGTPPIALSHGTGSTVWDVDGKAYLDLLAGIAVSSLGHAHPAFVRAVSDQAAKLAHTSNLYMHAPGVHLAERLLQLLGTDGRVFFCNSGAEANEAALKLALKAHGNSRRHFVAAERSFHGRTMGVLALTGKPAIREPFAPFAVDVTFVPYGDSDALVGAIRPDTAAVFLETTQGEGGIVPAPPGYLAAARAACDATGALLVFDEVQSGIGRTGAWFAHQSEGVRPDVVTLAKGLAGGLPIGVCIGLGDAGHVFGRGDHATTFAGNPVACAAALAVLDTIAEDDLLGNAKRVGEHLADAIVATGHPLVVGVRGSGLWRGVVLAADIAPDVEIAARDAGFLVNAVAPGVVRLAPPLILTSAEADMFAGELPAILDTAAGA
ncbi:MAG: acetylornithine/N-succinyldiaminopimelate aminotransferase [Frankiaceae bacterium]|jgi:acetylornithine aminotransferase|nr:acetylornithine/N-succinyldiaminopimelate aminotransferase [Frankiaceae bacterium]